MASNDNEDIFQKEGETNAEYCARMDKMRKDRARARGDAEEIERRLICQ
jgi:hypothetical protein